MISLIYYDKQGMRIKEIREDSIQVKRRIPSSWEISTYDFPEIQIALTPLKGGAKRVRITKFDYDGGSVDVILSDELIFKHATKENFTEAVRVIPGKIKLGAPTGEAEEEEVPVLQVFYYSPLSAGIPIKELFNISSNEKEFCRIKKISKDEWIYSFCASREATRREKFWDSPEIRVERVGPHHYRCQVQEFRSPAVTAIVGIGEDYLVGTFGKNHLGTEKDVWTGGMKVPGTLTARA